MGVEWQFGHQMIVTYINLLMSMNSGFLWALNSDQEKRDQELMQARTQGKQERADKKQAREQARVQVAGASGKQHRQATRKLQVQVSKQPVQDDALLAYWSDNPQASDAQVADVFGKSRQAIQQRREKLIKHGSIFMTANGVSVVVPAEKIMSSVEKRK